MSVRVCVLTWVWECVSVSVCSCECDSTSTTKVTKGSDPWTISYLPKTIREGEQAMNACVRACVCVCVCVCVKEPWYTNGDSVGHWRGSREWCGKLWKRHRKYKRIFGRQLQLRDRARASAHQFVKVKIIGVMYEKMCDEREDSREKEQEKLRKWENAREDSRRNSRRKSWIKS